MDKHFEGEIEQKKQQHNAVILQLQNATRRYKEEEQKLEKLRKLVNVHAQTKQNCQNLRRALKEEQEIFQAKGFEGKRKTDMPTSLTPDKAYKLPEAILSLQNTSQPMDADLALLKSLPPVSVLQARIAAYKANSEQLKRTANTLHDRSTDLEEKFRRVVALCTSVPVEEVDHVLDGLVQAVESDPTEVDTARVSSFLRKVDESIRCE